MANFDQFERIDKKEVGKGAFSKVYRVKQKNGSKIYAMKTIIKKDLSSRDRLDLQNEIQIHQKLNHPNIIRFVDYEENKETFEILLENAPNGCLFYFIHHREGLPEFLALKFTYQLAQAVKYLHQRTIAHRDIKPENVLFDKDFNVKLCDFGWATEISSNTLRTSVCGTSEYMSPEILSKKLHCKKVDIWCLGVFLYELLMGRPPFEGRNQEELVNNILSKRIMIKKNISKETRNLLKGLLQRNEKKRFNIYQVLDHEAFRNKVIEFHQPMQQKHFNLLVRNFLIKSLGGSNMILPESFENLDLKNYFQKQTTKIRPDEVPIDEEKEKECSPEKKEEQMLERIKQQLINKGIDVQSLRNLKKVESFRHNSNKNSDSDQIQKRNLHQNKNIENSNSITHKNNYHSESAQVRSYQRDSDYQSGSFRVQNFGNTSQKSVQVYKNSSLQNYQFSKNEQKQEQNQGNRLNQDKTKQEGTKQDQNDQQSSKIQPPQFSNIQQTRKAHSFSVDQKPLRQHDWSQRIYQTKESNNFYDNNKNIQNDSKQMNSNRQIIPVQQNQFYKRDDFQVNSVRAIPSYSFQNQFPSQQIATPTQRSNSMRVLHTPQFNSKPLIPARENNYYSREVNNNGVGSYSQSFTNNYRSSSLSTAYRPQNIDNNDQKTIYDTKIENTNNKPNQEVDQIKKESYHNVYGDISKELEKNKQQVQPQQNRQESREKRTPSRRVISLTRYNSNKDIYSQLQVKEANGIDLNVGQTQNTSNSQGLKVNDNLHNIYSKFKRQDNGLDKPRHYSLMSQGSTGLRYYN